MNASGLLACRCHRSFPPSGVANLRKHAPQCTAGLAIVDQDRLRDLRVQITNDNVLDGPSLSAYLLNISECHIFKVLVCYDCEAIVPFNMIDAHLPKHERRLTTEDAAWLTRYAQEHSVTASTEDVDEFHMGCRQSTKLHGIPVYDGFKCNGCVFFCRAKKTCSTIGRADTTGRPS
ncbi:hypothetical protein BC940DRAFT_112171 [Gongronella butleri]|nr:hypothetical protein BC940DRAFT_112171 [Gongronella butleri]